MKYTTSTFINLSFLLWSLSFLMPAFAQTNNYPRIYTPQNVSVNRTVPKNTIVPGDVIQAKFSKTPTDEEIFRVHFFEEPLVPTESRVSSAENTAFVYALAAFSQRRSQ